jgi:serine/threonine-protein kinase
MTETITEAQRESLLKLAQAVSDGKSVDWEAARTDTPGLHDLLESLRALESVKGAHVAHALADAGPIPDRWGSFEIRERIGVGGFAHVFRAFDPGLERDYALKLRRPPRPGSTTGQREFLNEARRLARVNHENVLRVYGAEEHDGRVGIWTELLDGETLEEKLDRQGPLSAPEAALIGLDLCLALAQIHRAGLVHRDVKTMNVMRVTGGRIVLMDFGSVADVAELARDESAGAAQGTPLTMAPEQLRGEKPRATADIWAVGVLLYRLVSRRYPVPASNLGELIEKHARGEIVPLCDVRSDLPPKFVAVVETALQFDPTKRYRSAGAMYLALADALGVVVTADVRRQIEAAPAIPIGRAIAVAAAAMLVLAIGFSGTHRVVIGRWPWEPPTPTPPPAAVVSPVFTASVKLFRAGPAGPEELLPGSRIQPGDHLYMQVYGSHPMYVYVLNEDEAGDGHVLFPSPYFDDKGPLSEHAMHRLPGTRNGERMDWQVTSAGGRERVLVVASRNRQMDIEDELKKVPAAAPDAPVRYAKLGEAAKERIKVLTRGIGGVAADPTPGSESGSLDGIARKASGVNDVWLWEMSLQNP